MTAAATAADGSWHVTDQLMVQLSAVGIVIVYAGIVTAGIVFLVDKTIGLRSSEDEEMSGLDHSYHGERGYGMLNAG